MHKALLTLFLLSLPLQAQEPRVPAQTPEAGSSVFGAAGCSSCHAIAGLGGGVGPDLGRVEGPRTVFDLGAAMWNHLPQMAERMTELGIARPRLRDDQAEALVVFLATQAYFDAPGDPARGRLVFAAKRCIRCHQVGGAGGVAGPPLDRSGLLTSSLDLAAAMWTHGPSMALEMRAQGIERPQLSGEDLNDLAAMLADRSRRSRPSGLRVLPGSPARGRELFWTKRCAVCHGAAGGGGIGPALTSRAATRSLSAFAAAIWNKTPAMMRRMATQDMTVPPISGEEMADLVGYLYSINYFAGAGNAARGRARIRDRGCVRCHTAGGSAPPLGEGAVPQLAAVVAALWNHVTVASEATPRSWPMLRPGDVADISAFLLEPR